MVDGIGWRRSDMVRMILQNESRDIGESESGAVVREFTGRSFVLVSVDDTGAEWYRCQMVPGTFETVDRHTAGVDG